jgi:hypothetical protein
MILEPGRNELRFGDPAVKRERPLEIRDTLPRDDRAEVRGFQGGRSALGHREARNPHEGDPTRTPRLPGRPLDQVGVVLRVELSENPRRSLGSVAPANIRLNHSVAAPSPMRRVGRLEPSEPGGIHLTGLDAREAHEKRSEPVRKVVLAVRRDGRYDGIPPVRRRAKQVREQANAVSHRYRKIPIKNRAVHGHRGPNPHCRLRQPAHGRGPSLKVPSCADPPPDRVPTSTIERGALGRGERPGLMASGTWERSRSTWGKRLTQV